MNMDALYKLTHGLYILGTSSDGRLYGSVVDAVMQVANKPWILAVSCNNNSFTKTVIETTGEFSLSVLGKKVDPSIIAIFGFQCSKNINKWDSVPHHVCGGLPYLDDSLASMRCKVIQRIVYESNTLFLAEVSDCADNKDGEPLTYNDYRSYLKKDVISSFEQLKATGKETNMTEKEQQKHWVCTVCGYVYDGEIPFEELPEDWVCPLCGVDKSYFVYE